MVNRIICFLQRNIPTLIIASRAATTRMRKCMHFPCSCTIPASNSQAMPSGRAVTRCAQSPRRAWLLFLRFSSLSPKSTGTLFAWPSKKLIKPQPIRSQFQRNPPQNDQSYPSAPTAVRETLSTKPHRNAGHCPIRRPLDQDHGQATTVRRPEPKCWTIGTARIVSFALKSKRSVTNDNSSRDNSNSRRSAL